MGYGITSESQIIDVNTIINGCKQIEEASDNFETCADIILKAARICDATALSVDKTTMQKTLEEDAAYIRNFKNEIFSFTSELVNTASRIQNAQLSELDNYNAQQSQNNG